VEQTGSPEKTLSSGEVAAAISNAVVRIYTEHHGRGPTRTKSYLFDDVVLTVMEESAATVEQTLAKAGDEQLVRDIRARVQGAVAEQLRGAVEQITGRRVRAFMSGSQLDPDVKCDVFLLQPQSAAEAEAG
jgi:uncharacterized protein YbcI